MAKIAFSKLKCKTNEEIVSCTFGTETIEIRQYLPIQEKLELISKVIIVAHEQDYNFSNPIKIKLFKELEMLQSYTNITFTDKQKENIPKLYDQVYASGLLQTVFDAIPESEKNILDEGLSDSIKSIYEYQNSVLGLLDNIKENYDTTSFDLNSIKDLIASDELKTLKDIVTKLD